MIQFRLNGCDICLDGEAPDDITLAQFLKQADRIIPDWCNCGIWSAEKANIKKFEPDLIFTYDDVRKVNEDVPCEIAEKEESE